MYVSRRGSRSEVDAPDLLGRSWAERILQGNASPHALAPGRTHTYLCPRILARRIKLDAGTSNSSTRVKKLKRYSAITVSKRAHLLLTRNTSP